MSSGVRIHLLLARLKLVHLVTVCVCVCAWSYGVSAYAHTSTDRLESYEINHGRNVWNFPRAEGPVSKVREYNFLGNQSAAPALLSPRTRTTLLPVLLPSSSTSTDEFHGLDRNRSGIRQLPSPEIVRHMPTDRIEYQPQPPSSQRLRLRHHFRPTHYHNHNHNDRAELILASATYEYPQSVPAPAPPLATALLPPSLYTNPFKFKDPPNQPNLYLPPKPVPSASTKPAPCKDGFDTLVADMALISTITSFVSLIFAGLSLFISNFYNVFGSALSVIFAGIPSMILNLFALADITLPSHSPFIIILTIISVFDSLNNLLSIVPGSLFSDLVGLISILIGKVSFGMGALSSYPQLLNKILKFFGVKDLIDTHYGCRTKTLGKWAQDFFSDNVQVFQQDDT